MFVLSLQKLKTGVDPSPFAVWAKMRTRDAPDPLTGSMWINESAELRSKGYTEKFKERNGDEADPLTSPLDVEAIVLAGQGAANGRWWIGDGSIDPRTVPSLRQVRLNVPLQESCLFPSSIKLWYSPLMFHLG